MKKILPIIFLSAIFIQILPILASEDLKLASWNIRILSDGSRDNTELQQIARIVSRYDIVAVQEIRDEAVLKRLMTYLPAEWSFIISEPVGRGVSERYAFLFDTTMVYPIGLPYIFPDPYDLFIREPYVAHFSTGSFDCSLITIHTIYGDSIDDRRDENSLLDDVVEQVDSANESENDIILLGDFNLPPDDYSWEMSGYMHIVAASEKTTISDRSSYDNIWISHSTAGSIRIISHDIFRFDEILFENNDDLASSCCSDHRPVALVFSAENDLDSPGNYLSVASPLPPTDDFSIISPDDYQHIDSNMIAIRDVVAKPTESESIMLKNSSSQQIALFGWTLGDKNDPHAFTFEAGTMIEPEQTLILHHSVLGFIINNSDEEIYLIRPDGVIVSTWSN